MGNKSVNGYYGSDLNKFIDQNCNREMTVNNIDLIMYKVSKNHIRIIESKHELENMPKSQYNLLCKLAELRTIGRCTFEVYIIKGDPPYLESKIINLSDKKVANVTKDMLIKFLNFEDVKLTWYPMR
jgi:hypothetical protein